MLVGGEGGVIIIVAVAVIMVVCRGVGVQHDGVDVVAHVGGGGVNLVVFLLLVLVVFTVLLS